MACGAQYEKRLIRERARLAVAGLSASERAAASGQVCRRVAELEAWREAYGGVGGGVVMLFVAMADEPGIATLEKMAFSAGARVALPRMDWDERRIVPVGVEGPGYATEIRRHGVVEPVVDGEGREVALGEIDLVVTPGIAFDRAGGRVGRGAGFYDRFLEEWREARRRLGIRDGMAVGVCFGAQLVERAPREAHDAWMDAVVWEGGVVMCRARG